MGVYPIPNHYEDNQKLSQQHLYRQSREKDPRHPRKMKPTHLAVLDFEANCLDGKVIWPQEITEVPIVFVEIATGEVVEEMTFHHYCQIDSQVTKFATRLTGITQKMCDNGTRFPEVMKLLEKHLLKHKLLELTEVPIETGKEEESKTEADSTTKVESELEMVNRILWVTCGDWDFGTCLTKQCEYSGIKVPWFMTSWCNLKKVFKDSYNTRCRGMKWMLDYFGLELRGRHHSGIDDVRNIVRMVQIILREGFSFYPTMNL